MCGCDYTHTVGGMGPKTAYTMIKEHGDIEGVLEKVQEKIDDDKAKDPTKKPKYTIPDSFLYKESRELFNNPEVISDKIEIEKALIWDKPNEEGLKEWLIESKGFTEVKVNNGIERLNKC